MVIDKVPEGGKDLAIRLFGTYDKLALQVGTIVLLLAFAAAVGVLGLRRLWYGLAGIGVFGVVGLVAAVTRTGATLVWVVPTLVATAAAAVTLYYLLRMLGQPEAQPDALRRFLRRPPTESLAPVKDFDRRRFLRAAGWSLAAPRSSGYAGRSLGEASSVNAARSAIHLPTPSGPVAQSPPGSDVAGLSYVVPNDDFYRIDTALLVPRIDPAQWKLKIHGRVAQPDDAHLRRPAQPADDRAVRDAELRLQRGRRRPGRQRQVAGRTAEGPARGGRPRPGRRPGGEPLRRRLLRRYADRGRCSTGGTR